MLRVYGDMESGNCYKVKLLVCQLGLAHEWIYRDIRTGVTRQPEFLGMNPNGRIPTLEYAPGKYLPESNAILFYLAEGTPYLSADRLEKAQTLQWLFFEQYSHEPHIATSRYYITFIKQAEKFKDELARRVKPGYAALGVMERHLTDHDYFAGGRYSIADIGLYAYTHVAHEGGFDLAPYPALQAWLARVKAQPGHVEMDPKYNAVQHTPGK
jgi:glutathione S-transferase